jgi:DsbC/DsbD-like thiol-disulfide interchange protein
MAMKSASLLALLCALAAPSFAQPRPADVTLLPGWRMENGNHMAAIRVTLSDGWKTYWRAPGDGGIPPEVDWSRSDNIAGVTFHWPVPQVIRQGNVTTVGYKHELVLPMELEPTRPGEPIRVDADLLVGICEEICVPLEAELDAVLGGGTAGQDPAILAALANLPESGEAAGVVTASCESEDLADGVRLTARIEMPALGPDETVVIEAADPAIWVSEASTDRTGSGALVAAADMVPPDGKPFDVAGDDVRLTVLADGRAVDIRGCPLD